MMDNIRPIRTEDDYDWALREIARHFDDRPAIGSREADRFDMLAALIEDYENRHYPISAPDPISALQAHMQTADLKQAALAEILGSRSRASEVLSRKRALTLDMVQKINRAWKIPAEILVQPYHLASR
jgi:HTH-type transcriptional regulator/antitoxin HigA